MGWGAAARIVEINRDVDTLRSLLVRVNIDSVSLGSATR